MAGTRRGDADTLSWEETPTVLRRLLRGVRLPAAVGVAVFVVAVTVTAVVMLRGIAGGAGSDVAELTAAAVDAGGIADLGGAGERGGARSAGTVIGGVDSAAEEAVVVVHLVGEVRRPGVVELSPGSRVLDAIEAAGGVTEAADLSALNLARQLSDGEQIQVFDAEAAARLREQGVGASADGAPGELAQGTNSSGGEVNVNTASAEELTQLTGIGPALAQRIVEWRANNGNFLSIEQLLEVSGIGAKTLERFRDRVRI